MRYAAGGRLLWTDHSLSLGNISTQMIVFPNRPDLVRWDDRHGHDYRFLVNNLPLWPPDALVWREEVIAVIRPHHGSVADRLRLGEPRLGPLPVEECPFREGVVDDRTRATARCRLLRQLSEVHDPRWCEIRRDACEACCASDPPSPRKVNPALASLLYLLSEEVIERGGVAGCSVEHASALRSFAERSIRC